jgi:hypothetical protein
MARRSREEYDMKKAQVINLEVIQKVDESRFTRDMDEVVAESEAMRLRYMKRHQDRGFLTMTFGMLLALAGACGFGWYFLMDMNPVKGALCMIPALLVPFLMHSWTEAPLKRYVRDYKKEFMPKMARALGGFKFSEGGGIPREMVGKTGVVPPHDNYATEDCFMGLHKGAKVIFSEARLRKGREIVFQGVFVMLETPHKIFEGHTIITADPMMVKNYAGKRWAKLSKVDIAIENKEWDRFSVYSDKAEDAKLLVGEKLLKELSEAADVFGKCDLTCVLFRGKFIFLMIPHKGDMFEPSSMFVPVSTKQHAVQCKREIERIIEIIDIFDIYKASMPTA